MASQRPRAHRRSRTEHLYPCCTAWQSGPVCVNTKAVCGSHATYSGGSPRSAPWPGVLSLSLVRSQTATSSIRLARAVEAARVSRKSLRATGLWRIAHSSRQLFQAISRALLMLQLPIKVATALR